MSRLPFAVADVIPATVEPLDPRCLIRHPRGLMTSPEMVKVRTGAREPCLGNLARLAE